MGGGELGEVSEDSVRGSTARNGKKYAARPVDPESGVCLFIIGSGGSSVCVSVDCQTIDPTKRRSFF
jgi:hypothetical protein